MKTCSSWGRLRATLIGMACTTFIVHTSPARAQVPIVSVLHLSQEDFRWAFDYLPGLLVDKTVGWQPFDECGCMLTSVSMVANTLLGPSLPHYLMEPKTIRFNPRYINQFLIYEDSPQPDSRPDPPVPTALGLKGPRSCGIEIAPEALVDMAFSRAVFDPVTNTLRSSPTGLRLSERKGADGHNAIAQGLLEGKPTILVTEFSDPRRHSYVVVGLTVDPSGKLAPLVLDAGDPVDSKPKPWVAKTEEGERFYSVFVLEPVISKGKVMVLEDDPGDFEFLAIASDGRKVGFDPSVGRFVYQTKRAGVYEMSDERGPADGTSPAPPSKFLWMDEPGENRFEIVGVGHGDYNITAYEVTDGIKGAKQVLAGPISPGQRIKYHANSGANGLILTPVDNFKPDARVLTEAMGVPGSPIQLDGRTSSDVDGTVESYNWNFGDNSTASGEPTVAHSFETPGIYQVSLTVTDNNGNSGTHTLPVQIFGPSATPLERVSVSSDEGQASARASLPSISSSGRFVAFASSSPDLVENGPTSQQIYVRDRIAGTTEVVSILSESMPASNHPSISGDGRYVAFVSGDNGWVFYRDRLKGTTKDVNAQVINKAGNSSYTVCGHPLISSDGRWLALTCSNIQFGVPAAVFLYDTANGTARLISAPPGGAAPQGNLFTANVPWAISPDGRYVVFESGITNLVPSDTNERDDLFVYDRITGTTERVSLSSTGSEANGHSDQAAISADGRFVAFISGANNLVPNDTNKFAGIYIRDRDTGITERIHSGFDGTQANGGPLGTSISADGRYVTFTSDASNLVPNDNDTNGDWDAFVYDRNLGTTDRVSVPSIPSPGGGAYSSISSDGRTIAFVATGPLTSSDTNGDLDVYVFDRASDKPPPILKVRPTGPYIGWASTAGNPTAVEFHLRAPLGSEASSLHVRWDFGDGSAPVTSAFGAEVKHSYTAPGNYVAAVVLIDGHVESEYATTAVEIFPAMESDRTSVSPSCGASGDVVTVSGHHVVPDLMSKGWDLANGPLPVQSIIVEAFGQSVSVPVVTPGFTFSTTFPFSGTAGSHDVGVRGGLRVSFESPCPPVQPEYPTSHAGGPYTGSIGVPIQFNGSGSTDPNGKPLTYLWYFGDGSQPGTGVNPTHTYSAAGTYEVVLWVNNGTLNSTPRGDPRGTAKVIVSAAPPTDVTIPHVTAVLGTAPNADGWHNADVQVDLSAVDEEGGSGVAQLVFRLEGAQSADDTMVTGSSTSLIITQEGQTTVSYYAVDNAGNSSAVASLLIRVDKAAPVIQCDPVDTHWRALDVSVGCSVRDDLSGLPAGAPDRLTLMTQVALGTETDNASTNVVLTCDVAANCSAVGPVGAIRIDRKTPDIFILSPTKVSYVLQENISAEYQCRDGGSGIAACHGSVPVGSSIDTSSVGQKFFMVEAKDQVGNRVTEEVKYLVGYNTCLLYDVDRPVKRGSAVPIRLQLCDSAGNNHSASAITLTTLSVRQVSSQISNEPVDTGQANPDSHFRYDPTIGGNGGYIYNFDTKGLGQGSYELTFTENRSGATYRAPFQVK